MALVVSLLPLMSLGADFEIPLSELAKVKKKAPAKTTVSKKNKKSRKNGEEKVSATAEEAVAAKEPAAARETAQPSQAVEEAGRIVLDEQHPAAPTDKELKVPSKTPPAPAPKTAAPTVTAAPTAATVAAVPASVPPVLPAKPALPAPTAAALPVAAPLPPVQPPAGSATIIHDPNSYIVTGKRTVILAIVSSSGEIRSVLCHFRIAVDGANASVSMVKVPGTQFTYSALIPALAPNSAGLRYSFSAIDAKDRVVRSKEYEVKVVNSPVVPGWQLDNFQDKLRVGLENPGKPLEGFQDAGLNK